MNPNTMSRKSKAVLLAAAGCTAAVFCARGADVSLLLIPEAQAPDTEVTATLSVPPLDGRQFIKVTADFRATPSNALSVAFGRDADGDGALSLRETAVSCGWDGAWFIRRKGEGQWQRLELAGAEGARRLEISQWLHRSRPQQRLVLAADGVDLSFGGDAATWLPLDALEGGLVRLTARGCGVEGSAEIVTAGDGAVLTFR